MSGLLKLISRVRVVHGHHCHRCTGMLMGEYGAQYCPNCLWDELEDPTLIRDVRFIRPRRRELKNVA